MKNILYISILLLALSSYTIAQDNNSALGRPTFGISGGVNFQNFNGKDDAGDKLSNSLITGFNVGIHGEIAIAQDFYFQVGLRFITKGTKGPVNYTDNNGTREITRKITLNYLELPIHLVYKPLLGNGHLLLGFGPYVGYSIGGKAKFTGTNVPADANIKFEKAIPSDGSNNLIYFKRLDVGGDIFVGYELQNGLSIVLNSQLGLININSDTSTELSNKNTGFGLSLGYRF